MEHDRTNNLGVTPTDTTLGTARTDAELGMNTTSTGHGTLAEDRGAGRSNFMAYLIGGLVIAVGLMAFLFYDGGTRDVNTTSSTAPSVQAPATPASPRTTPPSPAAPMGTPSPTTPAPAR